MVKQRASEANDTQFFLRLHEVMQFPFPCRILVRELFQAVYAGKRRLCTDAAHRFCEGGDILF